MGQSRACLPARPHAGPALFCKQSSSRSAGGHAPLLKPVTGSSLFASANVAHAVSQLSSVTDTKPSSSHVAFLRVATPYGSLAVPRARKRARHGGGAGLMQSAHTTRLAPAPAQWHGPRATAATFDTSRRKIPKYKWALYLLCEFQGSNAAAPCFSAVAPAGSAPARGPPR